MLKPTRPLAPPLNALRAFEAAARLGRFAAAAEELCVTPGAISQQIKTLEEWANQPLFLRNSGRAELTEAGSKIQGHLTAAFDEIGAVSQILRTGQSRSKVTIAAQPSVAQLWLQPRLSRTLRNHPTLDVSVHAIETPPNLDRTEFDLSIFLRPEKTGFYRVWPDNLVPMCTPATCDAIGTHGWNTVACLLDANWSNDWSHWGNATGQHTPPFGSVTQYSLYSMALNAAQNGTGVLMVHTALGGYEDLVHAAQQEVASGLFLCLEVAKGRTSAPEITSILNGLCDPILP